MISLLPPIKSCRSCTRAYLRVPGGRHYNYECCGIGAVPWMKHMPDDWACDLYQPGEYRPRVEVVTMIEGEEIQIA